VLELRGLTRRYGDLVALDDLSFTVAEGQMFGVVPHEVEVREPGTQPASLMS
jgi:ABC-type Na+ transport system ATPase subunit NatA